MRNESNSLAGEIEFFYGPVVRYKIAHLTTDSILNENANRTIYYSGVQIASFQTVSLQQKKKKNFNF